MVLALASSPNTIFYKTFLFILPLASVGVVATPGLDWTILGLFRSGLVQGWTSGIIGKGPSFIEMISVPSGQINPGHL